MQRVVPGNSGDHRDGITPSSLFTLNSPKPERTEKSLLFLIVKEPYSDGMRRGNSIFEHVRCAVSKRGNPAANWRQGSPPKIPSRSPAEITIKLLSKSVR